MGDHEVLVIGDLKVAGHREDSEETGSSGSVEKMHRRLELGEARVCPPELDRSAAATSTALGAGIVAVWQGFPPRRWRWLISQPAEGHKDQARACQKAWIPQKRRTSVGAERGTCQIGRAKSAVMSCRAAVLACELPVSASSHRDRIPTVANARCGSSDGHETSSLPRRRDSRAECGF